MPFCLLLSSTHPLPGDCPSIRHSANRRNHTTPELHVPGGRWPTPDAPVFRAIFHNVSRKISDTCRISGVGAHAPTGP